MGKRLGADLRDDGPDPSVVVEELELAQRTQVQGLRKAMPGSTRIVVRPADSSARGDAHLAGLSRELRSSHATAVFAAPVAVGSFFHLTFECDTAALPPAFARCDRCSLLAEDEFEVRFHFLHPLAVPGAGGAPGG